MLMYLQNKIAPNKQIDPEANCFIDKTKNFSGVLIIFVLATIIYTIITSSEAKPLYSTIPQSPAQPAQMQTVAFTKCPYCPGTLDAYGRCNQPQCPLFSPYAAKQSNTLNAKKCPYCTGILDANGRCNQKQCPLYSPNWQKPTKNIPLKRILIKELAMEISAAQGKNSVIINAVYPGGNAQKADLESGDRIVKFNGRTVKNVKQFQRIVTRAKPESYVEIKVIRNNNKIPASMMVGEGEMEGVTIPATMP